MHESVPCRNFFVLTGIDAAGKTTILDRVREERPQWEVGSLEPHDWLPHRSLPHLDWALDLHPRDVVHSLERGARAAMLLELITAHWEYWIEPRLLAERLVLVDSFWYRFYVKERIRQSAPDWFFRALDDLPDAAAVLIADIDPAQAVHRRSRFDTYEVWDESSPAQFVSFQRRVRDGLYELCERRGYATITIDATAPPEVAAASVVAAVESSTTSQNTAPSNATGSRLGRRRQ